MHELISQTCLHYIYIYIFKMFIFFSLYYCSFDDFCIFLLICPLLCSFSFLIICSFVHFLSFDIQLHIVVKQFISNNNCTYCHNYKFNLIFVLTTTIMFVGLCGGAFHLFVWGGGAFADVPMCFQYLLMLFSFSFLRAAHFTRTQVGWV